MKRNNFAIRLLVAGNHDLQAVSMDVLEEETGQKTSSMVDDAFFIVKKCVRYDKSVFCLDSVQIKNSCNFSQETLLAGQETDHI